MTDQSTDPATEGQQPSAAPEVPTTAPEAPEEEPAQYDAAYVRKLRREAADRRREAKEATERVAAQEAELAEHRAWRLDRAIVDANVGTMGLPRLADPSDLMTFTDRAELVDDAGQPDPARISAAIEALIARKPHLAAGFGRMGGAWDGAAGGSNPVPQPSLGELVGRAARGEREP